MLTFRRSFLPALTFALAGCVPGAATKTCVPTPATEDAGGPTAGADRDPTPEDTASEALVVRSVMTLGTDGAIDLVIEDGMVQSITPAGESDDAETIIEGADRVVIPGFIDSHVHLLFLPEADAMADGGIAAAVDLAAPLAFFETDFGDLHVVGSGPMVTAIGGYPTRSWGSQGYGLECRDADEAVAAVQALSDAGAIVIKLPIAGEPGLPEDALRAAATRAHELGLRVATHALGSDDALLAAAIGADVLAHTPTQTLSDEAVAAWSGKAVISTLRAFGGSSAAVENLRRLREAGAIVLYGTDFGNTRTTGIDRVELELLAQAGLDLPAIVAAGTTSPAAWWGLDGFGGLEVGDGANLIILESPSVEALASPDVVVLGGTVR